MTFPPSLPFRGRQALWLAALGYGLSGVARAAEGSPGTSGGVGWMIWGGIVVVVVVVSGVVVWSRRRRRGLVSKFPPAENGEPSLLEHTDCLLWEAEVYIEGEKWEWVVNLHNSVLAQRLFGRDLSRSPGRFWRELKIPEQEEMDRRCREAVLTGRPGYQQQFRVMKEGDLLWLNESVAIKPAGPGYCRLVGLVTDITAQRLAEQASQTTNERLQQLLAHAHCMLWQATVVRDEQGKFTWDWYVPKSELYRRIVGEYASNKVGMPWRVLNVPEFLEMQARSWHAMTSGLSGYEQEFRLIKEGKTMWMHEKVGITRLTSSSWALEGVIIDITRQREAEEARRTSEARLGRLLELADCMVWDAVMTLTPDDKWLWSVFMPRSALSRRVFDHMEEPRLDWKGMNIPEYEEMGTRAEQAVKSGASGYVQEFHVVKPNEVIWLREVVTIAPLPTGEFRLVGVIMDISAQRLAEEARKKSEGQVHELLFRANALLWEAKVELLPDDWEWEFDIQPSALWDRLYCGVKPNEVKGMFREFNIPEKKEMNARCRAALLDGRSGYDQVFHIIREDGVVMWVQESVTIKPLGESRFSLVGVLTDITRQHTAELALAHEKERLAVTLRAMTEGVITTDVAGCVQYINAAAMALTGWDDRAVGRLVGEICVLKHDRSGEVIEVSTTSVVRGNHVMPLPAQARLIARNGQRRIVEGCCAPIHSIDSSVNGMVLVFRDITEQDRLEQELVRATRLESVGILAGGIAHDFNNILTGVMGNLALAQMDGSDDAEVKERLREAEKATLRARDLTQQLLTFAKGGEPVLGEVYLEEILHETTSFVLHGSNVKVYYDIAPDLWAVDADKGQIGRVIQNLVINAVQAMLTGGNLRLVARNEKVAELNHPGLASGDYVYIAISDTGEGINPEHLSRIFDPYFTTKQTGTGLGLAAVYSIIKKHQGFIDVESQVGEGTTFRFWLPALLHPKTAPSSADAARLPSKFSGRLLFMDDEEVIRKMAGNMVRQLGFMVECAADGSEAVEMFRAAHAAGDPFRLVIMDLTVPGGFGGQEAIKRMREIDPQVIAIVSSGYSSDPVLSRYREHGFNGVMAKPYQYEEMVRAIRDASAGQSKATASQQGGVGSSPRRKVGPERK